MYVNYHGCVNIRAKMPSNKYYRSLHFREKCTTNLLNHRQPAPNVLFTIRCCDSYFTGTRFFFFALSVTHTHIHKSVLVTHHIAYDVIRIIVKSELLCGFCKSVPLLAEIM